MVNASDAAALAAAQSCANQADPSLPEDKADEFAKQNVTDLPADGIDNITEIVGCKTTSGHVTVHYEEQHPLFFAAILPGNGRTGTVATTTPTLVFPSIAENASCELEAHLSNRPVWSAAPPSQS